MKKIISKLLFTAIVLGLLPSGIVFAQEKNIDYNEAIDVVCGIGIMENISGNDFKSDDNVTRGELADIIAGMFIEEEKIAEIWEKQYMQDESRELQEIELGSSDDSKRFFDVDEENEYYDSVMKMYTMGIMQGISNDEFGVNNLVTGTQVLKSLVHILGYSYNAELNGGFPVGYLSMAYKLKLTSKAGDLSGSITRGQLAQLIYNALDVEINGVDIAENGKIMIGTSENETFMSEFLGLTKQKGIMTDNGYSTLLGPADSSSNTVTVNDVRFTVTEETKYAREFLGRNVEVYYPIEDDDGFVYMRRVNDETEVTFDCKNFIDYSNSEIRYEDEYREKRVRLDSKCTYMIKNGTAVPSYSKDDFIFDEGTITVLFKRGSSTADVIYINSYKTVMVDYINAEEKYIYGTAGEAERTELDENENRYVLIYDADGNETYFSAIKTGSVITVFESERSVKVYLKSEIVSDFKVNSVENDTAYNTVTVRGSDGEYTISREFIGRNPNKIPVSGKTYTFYLNAFSKIGYIEISSDSYNFGIFIKALRDDDNEESMHIKLYTTESNIVNRQLDSKVKLVYDNINGILTEKSYKLKNRDEYDTVFNLLSNYCGYRSVPDAKGGFFRYKINKEGKVTYIELPGEQKLTGNKDDRLVKIYDGDRPAYFRIVQGFGGMVIVEPSTVVFEVDPEMTDSEAGFAIKTRSVFYDDRTYNTAAQGYVTSFTTEKDSSAAQYVIYENEVKAVRQPSDTTYAIVKNVREGMDSDETPCHVLECMVNGKTSAVYYIDDTEYSEISNLQGDTAYAENGVSKKITLSPGDIVRYTEDKKGNLSNIFVLYDADAVNPASGGVGNIPGSTGKWSPDEEGTFRHTNPIAINDQHTVIDNESNIMNNSVGRLRLTACSAYRVFAGKYLTTTTCDLNVFNDDKVILGDSSYRTENWSVSNIIIVTKEKRGVSVNNGTISDIRTYEKTGRDCDRMMIMSCYQNPIACVIYRGF